MIRRKVGTLQKMIDAAAAKEQGVKWHHVLDYLEAHCIPDHSKDYVRLPFDSPFPAFYTAGEGLRKELWCDRETGDSLLRSVLHKTPVRIVAILCQLSKEAVEAPDKRGRLPLHYACRYPVSEELDKVMELLVKAYPAALLKRDDAGRTPLHYLFWFHASSRPVNLVATFCQKLQRTQFYSLKQAKPKFYTQDSNLKRYPLPEIPRPDGKTHVPPNAAIVPDSMHGCLPLHYAIMNGASLRAIYVLLQAYPLSKNICDRYGRTPLHWYFGAGSLEKGRRHVSGEPIDEESAEQWWKHTINLELVKMLLTSRVARTADRTGRYPLHWACSFLAHQYRYATGSGGGGMCLETIQQLLDHYIGQIICCDNQNMTPLFVLLDTTAKLMEEDWRTHDQRPVFDTIRGGTPAFSPPLELLEMLLKHPDVASSVNVAAIEDLSGRLPLHLAMEVAMTPEAIQLLLELHPTAIIHTSGELMVPLHAAFYREWSAPFQSARTINLLLQSFEAGRYGSLIDGRLGLKMEDSAGNYALHYACQNLACLQVIQTIVERYPQSALLQNSCGDLPVHCLLTDELMSAATCLGACGENEEENNESIAKDNLLLATEKMKILISPLTADKSKLEVADSKRGMLPLHVAVLFEAAPYTLLLRMLELNPESALQYASDPKYTFSALDFHDLRRHSWSGTEQDWVHIRELLYSFAPTLESHRHRQELLSCCVKLIVGELNGSRRFHLEAGHHVEESPPDLELTHTVSNMENFVLKKFSNRKRQRTQSKNTDQSIDNSNEPIVSNTTSIYDEDDTTFRYDSTNATSQVGETTYDDDTSSSSSCGTGISEEGYLSGEETEGDGTATAEDDEEFYPTFSTSRSSEFDDTTFDDTRTSGQETASRRDPNQRHDEMFPTFSTSRSSQLDGTTFGDTCVSDQENIPTTNPADSSPSKKFGEVLELAKRKVEDKKEKSGASKGKRSDKHRRQEDKTTQASYQRPRFVSEVALRIWTFFVLYCDPNNPGDNYVDQVSDVLDELEFSVAQELAQVTLPPFAGQYLGPAVTIDGFTFRDKASPKCRELIHRTAYFVGRYEFDAQDDILVHRSYDGSSVMVRASEWMFSTEEETDTGRPGMSEEQIWSTGEVPAEIGANFRTWKRHVWMKFTKNSFEYRNEVDNRKALGVTVEGVSQSQNGVVPLIGQYTALETGRKLDRMYRQDAYDERFDSVRLYGRSPTANADKEIYLKEYPYALVYPVSSRGSLYNYFLEHGAPTAIETRDICISIGNGLKDMHEKKMQHGNVSMQSVFMCTTDKKESQAQWSLGDLTFSSRFVKGSHLGAISFDGVPQFRMDTLPPEMFVKLSPTELKSYNAYWQAVQRIYKVQVDKSVIEPIIDLQTGSAYVVKCHYLAMSSNSTETLSLPTLPYELVGADTRADVWAFGLMMFALCAGRPLFASDARSGRLLDCREVCSWSEDLAQLAISEYVEDLLAQDVLLRLLTTKDRMQESMESILCRPFFASANLSSPAVLKGVVDTRNSEAFKAQRLLSRRQHDGFQQSWLSKRCVNINSWDFNLLERIHLSPTEITRMMTPNAPESVSPSSFLVLPYRLPFIDASPSEALSPAIEELAECFGKRLLDLSRTCVYVRELRSTLHSEIFESFGKMSSSQLLDKLALQGVIFEQFGAEMTELAAKHVEFFRQDPGAVAAKLVQKKLKAVLSFFESGPAYLYPVDEFNGVPVMGCMYPVKLSGECRNETVHNCILSMHLCSMYVRAISKGLPGLVKLLYRTTQTEIPDSWKEFATGLCHELDEETFVSEIKVLEEALSDMFSTSHKIGGDTVRIMEDFLDDVDLTRDLCGMIKVTAAGASIWTTVEGCAELEEKARSVSFKDALRKHKQTHV